MQRRRSDPYFDTGLRGWIVKTAKKNYWRMPSYVGLDDLVQEGLLSYAICKARYRDQVENRRHFMSLVQVVFLNRITDFANERTDTLEICVSQVAAEGRELHALEYLGGGYEGDGELMALLATAPAEVRGYLNLLMCPEGQAELDKPLRRRRDGTRETFEERLGLLLGRPVGDVRGKLVELLCPPDPKHVLAQWAAFFSTTLLEA